MGKKREFWGLGGHCGHPAGAPTKLIQVQPDKRPIAVKSWGGGSCPLLDACCCILHCDAMHPARRGGARLGTRDQSRLEADWDSRSQ